MQTAEIKGNSMASEELKDIFERGIVRGEIRFDEPLSAHTSLKIGGPVDIMLFPEDPRSLKDILLAAGKENIPVFVLGAGTNLLVADKGIEGIAVSLRAFRSIEFTRDTGENRAVLFAGAGVPLAMLVNFAAKNGYSGIENLAGIPGNVGGALWMNAGSFGREMKDVVVSAAVMNIRGEISLIDRDKMAFSYRRAHLPSGSIILSINIILQRDDPAEVQQRTKEFMKRKKETQPLGEMSAGCVFKNPQGDAAGRLIEAAGCKGMRQGDIEVSPVHANYFINKGRGTCRDFLALMNEVKARVRADSGIELKPEIRIIGEPE